MTLLAEIDEALALCRQEVERGDPLVFATTMIEFLVLWRDTLRSGCHDQERRNREVGGAFRYLSEDVRTLAHPIAKRVLDVGKRYANNEA